MQPVGANPGRPRDGESGVEPFDASDFVPKNVLCGCCSFMKFLQLFVSFWGGMNI